jgi:hypothetical protein
LDDNRVFIPKGKWYYTETIQIFATIPKPSHP